MALHGQTAARGTGRGMGGPLNPPNRGASTRLDRHTLLRGRPCDGTCGTRERSGCRSQLRGGTRPCRAGQHTRDGHARTNAGRRRAKWPRVAEVSAGICRPSRARRSRVISSRRRVSCARRAPSADRHHRGALCSNEAPWGQASSWGQAFFQGEGSAQPPPPPSTFLAAPPSPPASPYDALEVVLVGRPERVFARLDSRCSSSSSSAW